VLAQPEPHQVTAVLRLRVILELGAGVAERPVVDELDFARRKLEINHRTQERRYDGRIEG
jgi:hypothetical protein